MTLGQHYQDLGMIVIVSGGSTRKWRRLQLTAKMSLTIVKFTSAKGRAGIQVSGVNTRMVSDIKWLHRSGAREVDCVWMWMVNGEDDTNLERMI